MPPIVLIADYGINLLMLLIIVTSVMSWFHPDPSNAFVRLANGLVEPLLAPLRAILPTGLGMDFSPTLALLILWFLKSLLQRAAIAP